jgi:hypothetical protein
LTGRVSRRQRLVSAARHRAVVPDKKTSPLTGLLPRMIGGSHEARVEVLARAASSTSPSLLVAAAVLAQDPDVLTRAGQHAVTVRDRQLVALARARLRGDEDLFDALVRDHLAEHPDNLLAAWIAGHDLGHDLGATHIPEQEHDMTDPSTSTGPSTGTSTGTAPAVRPRTRRRALLRWMISFAGFPLGGAAAFLLFGPVDDLAAALTGGLVTGAVLGAVQAWALGDARPRATTWTLATAIGLMAGLALGASMVDYRTGLGDLALQGAVCGLLLGIAQATVLLPRLGLLALGWPAVLSGIWALGWVVSTSIGIRVDEQFTVFGSSGALVATALTAVLPWTLHRHAGRSTP